ncbi:HAD-IIA family hydrolase [Haliangium ochraceum]|uniref:Haloacid dehalogenase domain protein hydrolase n=1 Tax=Haliangium ochraceum (strain DSM 14365 / JCM 11303 / SMP-2) TaxID=502025 RepID=D0LYM9_HALO1|nr:HAD hydrolase-like protein [Haliangium ochraceum]ACY17895.1 Haloacid dehalogenase domain protein hydrolase [Haliangium ochraceum DSM 14365]
MPARISIPELVTRYEVLLLDAYGVLNDGRGPLASGLALVQEIERQGKRLFVVTNDASRLPATCEARFQRMGYAIAAEQIITSGSLLSGYFATHGLAGARCMVLGPEDSKSYVRQAGGEVIDVSADGDCDALIIGDDAGYPFLQSVEDALGMLYRHVNAGREVHCILPNPDLIYPKTEGQFGYTSGAVAALIELGLRRLFPGRALEFTPLGKPHQPMFEEARRRADTERLVMVGDQLETDIIGARGAGIDAALVATGVSAWREAEHTLAPTYLLA